MQPAASALTARHLARAAHAVRSGGIASSSSSAARSSTNSRTSRHACMAAELTADHVKCFAMNSVLGTQQTAPAVESSMFSGFGWQMHLPENPGGAEPRARRGRARVSIRDGKIAHIIYRHLGRPVSLFMLPKSRARVANWSKCSATKRRSGACGNRTFVPRRARAAAGGRADGVVRSGVDAVNYHSRWSLVIGR